jgi:membrane protein
MSQQGKANDTIDLTDGSLDQERREAAERGRGREADRPGEIPKRGWKDIALRVKQEARDDNLVIIAGGLAFFAMLSLGPAMVAAVSLYGLVSTPADVARHFDALSGAMPDEARRLFEEQLTEIASTSGSRLGVQAAIGLVLALWAASSGMKHLMVALSAIYDERESRGFVRLRLTALAVTAGALFFLVVALALIAGGPAWVEANVEETVGEVLAIARWPVLAVMMTVALAALYRVLPDRDNPRWRWVSWGAVVATVLWLVGSIGFSVYSSQFGNYDRTYGSMGAVVIALLWLFITALSILLGAEINAEIEHQTARDTTEGHSQPLGARDARMADTVGAST